MNYQVTRRSPQLDKLQNQCGAALLTVLIVSTLLVATGGALILATSVANKTAIDSTAEMQAYYSAEAGLANTLNVLRGNIQPNGAMPGGTQINFRNAIKLSTSNLPGDDSGNPRLSGWLNYNTSNGNRVGVSGDGNLAYSVLVSDPDNIPEATGEPTRLLLRVTGYGPKGAMKQLDVMVKRTNFDYVPPAMLMMRGSNDGTPVNFDIGDSEPKEYSGHDHAGSGVLPSFGATSDTDRDLEASADTKGTAADPKSATFGNASLPVWLRSADEARAFLADQKANAIGQGRYFTSFDGYSGSDASPAFTFVDGDCVLDGGAGLLIVTGNLEMKGNPNFNGLIIVLGGGTVNRDGGGNGNIYGAIAVAKFNVNGTGGFTAASFHTSGGGTSTMQYDSVAVRKALNISGPRVIGVGEY